MHWIEDFLEIKVIFNVSLKRESFEIKRINIDKWLIIIAMQSLDIRLSSQNFFSLYFFDFELKLLA